MCALAPELREQIDTANYGTRSMNADTVSRWLRQEHGIEISREAVRHHLLRRHHKRGVK